jgi:hypothetical protein
LDDTYKEESTMHTVSEATTQTTADEKLAKSIAACREQAKELRRGADELEAAATRWETITELGEAGLLIPSFS